MIGTYWYETRDGDKRGKLLYDRHYSRNPYTADRNNKLFVGPGQKMVLLTIDGLALFVWRRFYDRFMQSTGVNCAVFRNETTGPTHLLSSALILEAEQWAWQRWPGERLYTYVDASKIKSNNPGYCFLCAGWHKTGQITERHKLIVLAKDGQNDGKLDL